MGTSLLQKKSARSAPSPPSSSEAEEAARQQTIVFFDHTAAWSGGEIALYHLVCALDATRYKRIVVLGSDGPLREKLVAAGIETHVLALNANVVNTRKDSLGKNSLLKFGAVSQTLGYARRLARFLSEFQADLLHTNSLKSDVIGGIAARLARVPVIWHIRDRIEPDYLPRPVVRVFRGLCRVLPNGVIANSQSTLETLHLPPRFPADVVYSGVVEADLSAAAAPESAALPCDPPLIGIVGRISPWKGQHIFIEAAALVRKRFPAARFQIIGAALFGEEAYEAQVRKQAAEAGLGDGLEFLGFRSDVPDLMQHLTILAHASTSPEPFGQVVVQGMTAGRPVVATRGGGVTEIVEDGVTGLLVPMGNAEAMAEAILTLLDAPERAVAMGQAGKQRALAHFTIEQSARKLDSFYRGLPKRREK